MYTLEMSLKEKQDLLNSHLWTHYLARIRGSPKLATYLALQASELAKQLGFEQHQFLALQAQAQVAINSRKPEDAILYLDSASVSSVPSLTSLSMQVMRADILRQEDLAIEANQAYRQAQSELASLQGQFFAHQKLSLDEQMLAPLMARITREQSELSCLTKEPPLKFKQSTFFWKQSKWM